MSAKTKRTRYNKRKRRQFRASLVNKKAKPTHKCKTGRTGKIREKRNHSPKKFIYSTSVKVGIPPGLRQLNEIYSKHKKRETI